MVNYLEEDKFQIFLKRNINTYDTKHELITAFMWINNEHSVLKRERYSKQYDANIVLSR